MLSDLPPDPLAALTPPTKPFLIAPATRLQFILLFTLLTFLGGLVAIRVSAGLSPGLDGMPAGVSDVGQQGLELILTGTAIGLAQWFVLRRHVSGWQWIVATSVGWIVANAVALSWMEGLGEFFSNLAFIWLGFAQWLVLRQFAKPAGFWILLPCVASFGSFLLAPLFNALANTVGQLGALLLLSVNQFAILGVVEAIALCTLRQKGRNSHRRGAATDLGLATAPEITNLEQLRAIAQQLQAQLQTQLQTQLHQAAMTEIAGEQDLIYLVDVAEDGAIADYQPVNQAAFDYIDKTPLPTLLVVAESPQAEASQPRSLGRLQVIFQTAGRLVIRSATGELLA